MDTAALFRVLGDGLSIVSLSLIASTSLQAWKRTPVGTKVPMQWSASGKPGWRLDRNLAFLFTPVMATVILLVPTAMGTTRNAVGLDQILIVFCVRALMASGACLINLSWLKHAFKTLEEEGVKLS